MLGDILLTVNTDILLTADIFLDGKIVQVMISLLLENNMIEI